MSDTSMSGPAIRHLPAAPVTWERAADVVIIGAGVAGLSAALEASARGRRVLLICKAGLVAGSSPLAQGGLAAVLDPADSAGLHHRDTITAGAGLCDDAAVEALVGAAPGEIAWLRELGARFDSGPLGLEGGHSWPRILHAGGDASGAEVHRALRDAVLASPVEILDHTIALDALLDDSGRVAGLLAGTLTTPAGPELTGRPLAVGAITARAVVLATGGYGQAYTTTTNPAGATGDGLALALRAGAELADLEFVQFHPTILWQAAGRGQQPLVTEALRGAGAVLIDAAGRPVMAGKHPRGDLAPRDVVAAELYRRLAASEPPAAHLWLDATGLGRAELERHFPTVTAACRARGIEPSAEPIPVAPGAHYACGGIRADMSGHTSLPGLYAVGEVAATGVHGANRLASNSLTEAITAGRRVGRLLGAGQPDDSGSLTASPASPAGPDAGTAGRPMSAGSRTVRATGAASVRGPGAGAGAAPGSRDELAAAMSRYAGVLRDGPGLAHLLGLLAAVPPAAPAGALARAGASAGPAGAGTTSAEAANQAGSLDLETVEATNLHTVSTLVAAAALARTESRGCHRRSDFPDTRPGAGQRTTMRSRAGQLDLHSGDQPAEWIGLPA
ncbi:MAG TPA: FAD-dependent oxidoreductase [Streptosporangiaceae bacterium]|nr:FAD-dependent oxidoreductase [Streptosporangiaceae bacterium]